ncbi:hypothetical protein GIB67_041687 [Kingdonia uniflora]|uniref:Fatty acyl-CoA reductase n=1 Tax=Kingdonia uniflora TaxID=39325 RepID=A0A7J7MQS1_9MAGN|nr:hypothetical protein GIB67_041687 [Kingdonia uniflora]
MVKRSNFAASLSELVSTVRRDPDSAGTAVASAHSGRLPMGYQREQNSLCSVFTKKLIAQSQEIQLCKFAIPIGNLRAHRVPDAYAECPDTSVALMLESELDDSTRLKGWIEMQNSTPRCFLARSEKTLQSKNIMPLGGYCLSMVVGSKLPEDVDEMWRDTEIVVNTAATIKFDEKYDIAFSTNTLGAKNVLEFAKKCVKLHNLVHVSTAYVCGEKLGLVLEKAFEMGETLNGEILYAHIEYEHKVVRDTLDGLRAQGVTKELERAAMKELGLKKARQYAWLNTYVFTKAMGEMLIGQLRDLPVSIICLSIITSTIREPFPGSIEGISRIDRLTIGYGKGKIPCFVGDPELVID